MKLNIIHPDDQPGAAQLAKAIFEALPAEALADAEVSPASRADASQADLVVAVFNLKHGAFAPTVACYRELRGRKVAFLAGLSGEVNFVRLRKSAWGIKKQFCGNHLLGGLFCALDNGEDPQALAAEVPKARDFILKLHDALTAAGQDPVPMPNTHAEGRELLAGNM